jgi:hypothetical protein
MLETRAGKFAECEAHSHQPGSRAVPLAFASTFDALDGAAGEEARRGKLIP